MLGAIRRMRGTAVVSTATLLCLVSLSLSSFFHSDADDALCDPVLVIHDHTAHRLSADTGAPAAPEHCFLCHWHSLRTVHAVVRFHAPATESRSVATILVLGLDSAQLSRQAARAPPLV